ncbi:MULTISPECIES: hypothetical protein [Halorussus]|uniref:hypothetical protein n=1 Tax=Halorussus TaxID=1070314 RepID=UPI0020A111E3|nr:hypothetical protein [Halorussus vallis]USZ78694.1 hypothetical protein NGM07_24600 [Halorussus vallis]
MSEYDVERFNDILREHLYQAASEGLDEDELVAVLRQHQEGIERDGLASHAGLVENPFDQSRRDSGLAD